MKRFLFVLTSFVGLMAPAAASPIAPINVPDLITSSDLVVVASASSGPRGSYTHKVSIERILKGTPSEATAAMAYISLSLPRDGNTHAILFLRHDTQGYVFSSMDHAFVLASPTDRLVEPLSDDVERNVADYLMSVLTLPEDFVTDERNGLKSPIVTIGVPITTALPVRPTEFVKPTRVVLAEDTYGQSLEALLTIHADYVKPRLQEVVDSANSSMLGRAVAFAGLLRLGDFSRLPRMMPYLLKPLSDARLSSVKIENGLEAGSAPASMTQDIAELMWSPDMYIREGAAYSLRSLNGPQVIAALEKGLFDPFELVRWDSSAGLCALTDECPSDKFGLYTRPENAHLLIDIVNKWKQEKN